MDSYQKLLQLETTPEALEATVSYVAERIKPFLQLLEPVLICFPDEGSDSLGGVLREAVLRCEAKPVFWGPDYRWKELLRVAFDTHANTIIGPPEIVLGLSKLAFATATPLYAYDVIVAGDPFASWMIKSLKKGFDCNIWGCYALHGSAVIGGFSCAQEVGIHIREDVFEPRLHESGKILADTNRGGLHLVSVKDEHVVIDPEVTVLLHRQPCCCGCDEPRVADVKTVNADKSLREKLDSELLTWSSVLDYRVDYTEFGAALEMVVFAGEQIPNLPSFAKQNVRKWNPETDIPFCMHSYVEKIPEKTAEDH